MESSCTRSWNLYDSQHTSTGTRCAAAIIATAAVPARDSTAPLESTEAAPRKTCAGRCGTRGVGGVQGCVRGGCGNKEWGWEREQRQLPRDSPRPRPPASTHLVDLCDLVGEGVEVAVLAGHPRLQQRAERAPPLQQRPRVDHHHVKALARLQKIGYESVEASRKLLLSRRCGRPHASRPPASFPPSRALLHPLPPCAPPPAWHRQRWSGRRS